MKKKSKVNCKLMSSSRKEGIEEEAEEDGGAGVG